ncbi:hypothetical protein [Alkalihalobacillus deserti]|uniref:hypothetical protein n=1 Tax=Alkalihalobacillus deserti TaxID=2879466 RepID=UPI001D14042C|nr:hypothetical protein [Alkalihalobacillus deserti]
MSNQSYRFSGENQNVEDLARWFQLNTESIQLYRKQVLNEEIIPEQFVGMSRQEVQEYFLALLREVELSFCLSMIAAIEARFRMDYLIRATERLKDDLSRDFRDMYKEKAANISLEEMILENWKMRYPNFKGYISDYIGALKYRHWLAHGRYWNPKLGKKYDATSVYLICKNIINELPLSI